MQKLAIQVRVNQGEMKASAVLHSDRQLAAIGFSTQTSTLEFADPARGGMYWRHADRALLRGRAVTGLPYAGHGVHTRE